MTETDLSIGNDDELQAQDFEWFLDNYDALFKKYGDSYIAIRNKTVLGTYGSFEEGVKATKESLPLGAFIVQHCNGSESGYTNYIASMNFMGGFPQ